MPSEKEEKPKVEKINWACEWLESKFELDLCDPIKEKLGKEACKPHIIVKPCLPIEEKFDRFPECHPYSGPSAFYCEPPICRPDCYPHVCNPDKCHPDRCNPDVGTIPVCQPHSCGPCFPQLPHTCRPTSYERPIHTPAYGHEYWSRPQILLHCWPAEDQWCPPKEGCSPDIKPSLNRRLDEIDESIKSIKDEITEIKKKIER